MISQFKGVLRNKKVQFQHIIREGNNLVDYLDNLETYKGNKIFEIFKEMETTRKWLVNNEKLKCPYIRLLLSKGWKV